MPELVYPPKNPVWPPVGALSSGVIPHIVQFTPPRPGRNEKHGPVQSFLDICKERQISFERLIEFNFGLVKGEDKYFEKINWYLKHRLGCKKTTEKGNFCFSGGETVYIPPQKLEFEEPVSIVMPRKRAGAIRWIKFAQKDASKSGQDEPDYMIPGVDRTATPPESSLPGNSGAAANKAEGVAALVQFVASTTTSKLAQMSSQVRLEKIEAPPREGGWGVAKALQPSGRHEAIVVAIRISKNKHDPSFPKLPFREPLFIGYGDVKEAGDIIERFWKTNPQFDKPDPAIADCIIEYYLGTRLGPDSR